MWYYSIDQNPQGPTDEATIAQWITNGMIPANTMVWREGMADWAPIGSTELARYGAPRQAAPQPAGVVRRPPAVAPRQYRPVAAHTQATAHAVNPAAHAVNPAAQAVNPAAYGASRPSQYAPVATSMTWSQILWGFNGRIPRRKYWAGLGIWMGSNIALTVLLALVAPHVDQEKLVLLAIPLALMAIPSIWSSIALQVKRWHDRDKPGAMVLVNLIPMVGGIWAFVECGCLRGTVGPNQFGKDPT